MLHGIFSNKFIIKYILGMHVGITNETKTFLHAETIIVMYRFGVPFNMVNERVSMQIKSYIEHTFHIFIDFIICYLIVSGIMLNMTMTIIRKYSKQPL